VRCWGANGSLQLGDGSITKSTTPITVRNLSNVTSIAAFGNFTCAVLTDRTLKCWGANGWGELGRDTSLGTTPASIPAPVTDLSKVVAVATGGRYACAHLTDGTVRCWGANDRSQLGPNVPLDPSTGKPFRESLIPVAVGLSNVAAIAAGFDYTCAVLTNGTVKCWGANSPTPVDVGLTDVDTIAVGGQDCAIFKNGTVSCSLGGLFSPARELVELTGQAIAIAAGYDHACGRLTDGTVKCWGGFNDTGELGNGTFTNPATPFTPVRVVNLANVVGIAAGGHHSCATLLNGTARCWGDNSSGQLGNRTTDRSSIPQVVIGLSNVVAVTAGNQHTCARLTDGTVSCWGENRSGELGNGTILSTIEPVKVVGIP
jgi:alpha-tubulin suppressor-like RCC1 family protein